MVEGVIPFISDHLVSKISVDAHQKLSRLHPTPILWNDLDEGLKKYAIAATKYALQDRKITAKEVHDHWLNDRRAAGWVFGDTHDKDNKRHPSLIPFHNLDNSEQQKDKLFLKVVRKLYKHRKYDRFKRKNR